MKHSDDTISAIATPLGVGGVGIVRVSGPSCRDILSTLTPLDRGQFISHKMEHGWIIDPKSSNKIDDAMYCFMAGPKSFTGEDVAEFYCHGSNAILKQVLSLTLMHGARLAQKGEFTKRAFLNGKLDLSQAEAVLDMVCASTTKGSGLALAQLEGRLSGIVNNVRGKLLEILAQLDASIDFEDDVGSINHDELLGRVEAEIKWVEQLIDSSRTLKIYRDGVTAVIIGKPNVGKSSLLNALLKEERAIVAETPGTTRDTIVETIDVHGVPVRLVDTAGIREPAAGIELAGVERAEKEASNADLVLTVLDGAGQITNEDRRILLKGKERGALVIINKSDLPLVLKGPDIKKELNGHRFLRVSALRGDGINELVDMIYNNVCALNGNGFNASSSILVNERHKECLEKARDCLARALESCQQKMGESVVAVDIKDAVVSLGEISGELVSDEVVNSIFEKFCIGK